MIIVSGKVYVRPGTRSRFFESSLEAVKQAREMPGCWDFVVAADPVEADRVNVYEKWDSEEKLLAFRDGGPDQSLTSAILQAEVTKHVISSSGPA